MQPKERYTQAHQQNMDKSEWLTPILPGCSTDSRTCEHTWQDYLFEASTSRLILLSYAACDRLGILEIKITNKASSTIDSMESNTKKHIALTSPTETTLPEPTHTHLTGDAQTHLKATYNSHISYRRSFKICSVPNDSFSYLTP